MAKYDDAAQNFFNNLGKTPVPQAGASGGDVVSTFFNNLPAPRAQAPQAPQPVAQPQQNVFDKAVNFIKSIPEAFKYAAQPEIQQKPPAMDIQAKATQEKILKKVGGKTTVNIKDMSGIIKALPKEIAQTKVKESLIGGVKALPGQLEQGWGIILANVVSISKFMDDYMYAPVRKIGIMPTYNIDTKMKKGVAEAGLQLREKGTQDVKKAHEEYAKTYKPSPGIAESLESLLYNVPQVGASIGLSMGTLAITRNPGLAYVVGFPTSYALNSAEIYDEARSYGLSDSQSLPMATYGGIAMSALDNLPIINLVNKSMGRVVLKEAQQDIIKKSLLQNVKRAMIDTSTQSGAEGVTEGLQTILQNAIAKTYNDNKSLLEGVPESIFVGALLGAGSDVTMGSIDSLMNAVQNNKVEKMVQKAINTTKDKRTPEQQQLIDVVTTQEMTPDNAIQFVVDNELGKTKEGKAIVLEAIKAKDANMNLRVALSPDEKSAEITQVNPGKGFPYPTEKKTVADTSQPQTKPQDVVGESRVGENLAQEAKNYSSVDEFIKAQGKPLFHGTHAEFQTFDKSKIGSATDEGFFGKGFYFANTESFARVAPGGRGAKNIMEVYLSPDAKLFDIASIKDKKQMADYLNMSEDALIQDDNGIIRPIRGQSGQFTSKLQELGFDGAIIKRGGDAIETVIFEPDKIKTKSQLTDIYNKSIQPSVSSSTKTDLKIKESKNLNDDEKRVETDFADYLQNNYDEARKRYKEAFGSVINTDNARELSKDYAPDGINSTTQTTKDARSKYAAAVHEPASAFMRKMYADDLAEIAAKGKKPEVFFSAGGTGAGKSTGIKNIELIKALQGDADIVYDTNLNNFASSTEKIDQALKAGADVNIAFVHRDIVDAFVNGTLPRAEKMGRTVPLEEHINTHVQSPENIVNLVKHYDNNKAVNILFVDNSLRKGNAKRATIDITEQAKYNKDEIRKKLLDELQKAYENGSISKAVYEGTKRNGDVTVGQSNLQKSVREGRKDNGGTSQQPQQPGISKEQVTQAPEKPLTKTTTQKSEGISPQLPVAGTGVGKEKSRLQERIQEQLLSMDQGKYEFDEKSGKYNKLNLESDAKKAIDFMESNPEQALRVARGLEPAPEGQTHTGIALAVAFKARDEGNYELWKNTLTTTSLRNTRYGQENVVLRGQFNDNSPENFIKRALNARIEALGGGIVTEAQQKLGVLQGKKDKTSAKTKVIERIDKETEALSNRLRSEQKKIQLAQDLINSLICK